MTNKRNKISFICLFTAILFAATAMSSCGGERKAPERHHRSGSLLTPKSSGNPYEVMVVAPDSVYNGYAGKAVQTIMDKSILGLPQPEAQFHKSHIQPKSFSTVTNIFRTIIKLEIDHTWTKCKMIVERNVNADPQLILTFHAPDQVSLSQYITEHTKQIEDLIKSHEINIEANNLYFKHNIKFAEKVKEMFGCEFYIPVDLKEMKVGKDFVWASDDGNSVIQNICIYSYPYVSEKMLNRNPYIALRDTMMKRNIPGYRADMWMETNRDFVWVKPVTVQDGAYAMEARGLWQMRHDAMGGPFVSHSRIDTVNNKVITVEGFVFAPEKMKRTMIRRLEAALYTLELPKKE